MSSTKRNSRLGVPVPQMVTLGACLVFASWKLRISLSGVISGDTVTVSNSGATFADKNAATGKTVTLAGVTLASTDAGNYSIASTATDTADIVAITAIAAPAPLNTNPPPPPVQPNAPLPRPATNPPPLVLQSQTAAPSADRSTGVAPVATGAPGGGVSVSLLRPPAIREAGIIAVVVPKATATAGVGFSFLLPKRVTESAPPGAAIRAAMPDGGALPRWLHFSPETQTFTASAVPDSAFPITVVVTVGSLRSTVVISERGEE